MRALLSVYDKTGVAAFASGLAALGVELVASGGTAKVLDAAGIDHLEVAEVTGVPEMLGGRVKTLHPGIHAAILADRSIESHLEDLAAQDITAIDIVACNLYPFESEPSIEMIDIGGPAMVRAAAKNHAHVTVLVDPDQYGPVLDELRRDGTVSELTRAGWHVPRLPTRPPTTRRSSAGSTRRAVAKRSAQGLCRRRCMSPSSESRSSVTGRTRISGRPATARSPGPAGCWDGVLSSTAAGSFPS